MVAFISSDPLEETPEAPVPTNMSTAADLLRQGAGKALFPPSSPWKLGGYCRLQMQGGAPNGLWVADPAGTFNLQRQRSPVFSGGEEGVKFSGFTIQESQPSPHCCWLWFPWSGSYLSNLSVCDSSVFQQHWSGKCTRWWDKRLMGDRSGKAMSSSSTYLLSL